MLKKIKQLKPFNIFSLLKKLLLGRFVLFIFNYILIYSLNFPIYLRLLLITLFLAFIIYLIVKFNVISHIKNVYKDICRLYKQDHVLCILLLSITYIICQILFLLLYGILSPFEHFYFVGILISVLKTSILSFFDFPSNNTIRFMNSEGSSNPANLGSSGSDILNKEIPNYDRLRFNTAAKLRNIYVNRPYKVSVLMNDPQYADRINRLDHNIVCKAILDNRSHLYKHLDDSTGEIKYKGIITLELLHILEK